MRTEMPYTDSMARIEATLFGSQAFPRLLAVLMDQPGRAMTAAELATELKSPNRDSLYRAIRRALAIGVIRRNSQGRASTYEANTASPIYPELKNLLAKLVGVVGALRAALSSHGPPSIEAAFIFGSVAQDRDSYKSDIDIFVIGSITAFELSDALRRVQSEYRRELNPVVFSRDRVEVGLSKGDPFLQNVWSQPKIFLVGDESDLPDVVREPSPYFNQELGTGPYQRAYAAFVVGAVPATSIELSDHDPEVVEAWFRTINPRATPQRANPTVDWWQEDSQGRMDPEWQGWLYPGPVIAVRQLALLVDRGDFYAIRLDELTGWWKRLAQELPPVLRQLNVSRLKVGFSAYTYEQQRPVAEVAFGGIAEPVKGAPAGQVPPWTYRTDVLPVEALSTSMLRGPTTSLLRHFGYRHIDATLTSLALNPVG